MSFSTARTCAFGSRSAISRHSAARSLHSLDVIIGYSPNRTDTPIYHRNVALASFPNVAPDGSNWHVASALPRRRSRRQLSALHWSRLPPCLVGLEVAAWAGEAGDNTKLDRVFSENEGDWDGRGCRLGRAYGRDSPGCDHSAIAIEFRFSDGQDDQLPGLAADLVRRRVGCWWQPTGLRRWRRPRPRPFRLCAPAEQTRSRLASLPA
jgi:hypothetical protein